MNEYSQRSEEEELLKRVIPLSDFKKHCSALLKWSREDTKRLFITRNGWIEHVVVPAWVHTKEWQELCSWRYRFDDSLDAETRALLKASAEPSGPPNEKSDGPIPGLKGVWWPDNWKERLID